MISRTIRSVVALIRLTVDFGCLLVLYNPYIDPQKLRVFSDGLWFSCALQVEKRLDCRASTPTYKNSDC